MLCLVMVEDAAEEWAADDSCSERGLAGFGRFAAGFAGGFSASKDFFLPLATAGILVEDLEVACFGLGGLALWILLPCALDSCRRFLSNRSSLSFAS